LSDKQLDAVSQVAKIVVDRAIETYGSDKSKRMEKTKEKIEEIIESFRGRIEKLELDNARQGGAFLSADKIIAYLIGAVGAASAVYSSVK
ncbi:MAG: hypothetical protein MIO92_08960, partial [Methanosarcinaceae archaeon]|nr:hypothetical protein [Methanosarcinaceae archaeon]